MMQRLFVIALIVGLTAHAEAGGEFSGFIAADVRAFPSEPTLDGQRDRPLSPSLLLQPEYRYEWNDGKDRLTAIPFARLEYDDPRRLHVDIRELNWLHVGSTWDLLFGVGKVFWGVAESQHLADIINQTDLIEDIDTEDKLGQPMIKFTYLTDWGDFIFLAMPRFRERTFPGRRGRLRSALLVDTDRPVYDTELEEWHPSLALRWTHSLGDWDIGLAHFWGISREPRLLLDLAPDGAPVLRPHYDLIHQTSLDLQVTMGSFLGKLEVITRAGQGRRFAALVGGFEYTFFGIFGSAADLGLLAEYLFDDRSTAAPQTPFADDIFTGARLAFNDTQDTSVLAGTILDRRTQTIFLSVEASRRLGERWTIELEARAFLNITDPNDLLFSLRREDYVQIRIARFF